MLKSMVRAYVGYVQLCTECIPILTGRGFGRSFPLKLSRNTSRAVDLRHASVGLGSTLVSGLRDSQVLVPGQ